MTWVALTAAALLAAPAATPTATESLIGTVSVGGSSVMQIITLKTPEGQVVQLRGEALDELTRLATVVVEVLGSRDADGRFVVATYRILDVGGGARPWVGVVERAGEGTFALRDGDGSTIPLSLAPRSRSRMQREVGAKIWVHGQKLVSGELKVLRYGVLRAPAGARAGGDASKTGDTLPAAGPAGGASQ